MRGNIRHLGKGDAVLSRGKATWGAIGAPQNLSPHVQCWCRSSRYRTWGEDRDAARVVFPEVVLHFGRPLPEEGLAILDHRIELGRDPVVASSLLDGNDPRQAAVKIVRAVRQVNFGRI